MLSISGKVAELTLQWVNPDVPYLAFTKTFQFRVEDTVWIAKKAVLVEFAQMNLSDPLNFGFYLPPHNGRAGKFLDEERPLKDYPMTKEQPFLEFRYKRKIFRGVNMEEKKLLKQNSKAQQRKFVETINTQSVEKVAAFLEKGIDPNFQDDKTGETPLTYAVANPQAPELIKLLVGNGAHLDYRTADGYTALHRAAILGNSDALKSLLDLGASPNCKDAKGLTPLYHTVLEGSDSYCCELLLADYAQTGFVDHQGIQEIHQACRKGRVHHLEFLLYYGVDVNARTASGNTPLHICAISNDANCVELLLCRGADRSLVNYSNQSAYEVAIIAGNHEIAEQIKIFKNSDVQPFTTSPRYTNRGKGCRVLAKVRSFENLLAEPSPFLKRALSDSTMDTKMLHRTSEVECSVSENRLYGNKEPLVEGESGESDSDESDSDDGMSTVRRRTFSNTGVGTPRAPAPLKSTAGGAAQLKSRLYASVPGRTFVAVIDYKPNAPGELALEKGEQVEVLYVGEQGFWEGRVGGRAGWFPSCCVQEIKKPKKNRPKSWFGPKKSSSLELLEKISKFEKPMPRKVSLKRNDKGFGFQLRGANSHAARIEFVPTAQYPALQYIGEVDKGGVADKMGLKAGDFLLEVNGEDVSNASHAYAVNVINKGGKTITMKVVTITPESVGPDLTIEDGAVKGTLRKERSNSVDKKQPPPKPPVRSPYTCLTMGRMTGAQLQLAREEFARVPQEGTVMTLEKKEVTRKPSMKSIWAESAWKLHSSESTVCDGDNVPRVISRRNEVGKGVIRNERVKSMDVERHYMNHTNSSTNGLSKDDWSSSRHPQGSDLANDIRPIGANYPGYLTLPRKSSRKSSESSDDDPSRFGRNRLSSNSSVENGTTNGHRNAPPPDYEHTMENLRKMGRKSSFTYEHEQSTPPGAEDSGRTLPRCHTVPSRISDQDVMAESYEERHRHHLVNAPPSVYAAPTTPTITTRMPEFRSSLVEGASYRTLPRSVSVPSQPIQPVVVPHLSSSLSENLVSQPSAREPEREENLSAFAQSLASAVKRRESRVSKSGKDCEAIISERRKSIVGTKLTGAQKNVEERTPAIGGEIKVTLNGDESPKGMAKLGGAEHLLQRRDSKGSDYFSLYTSSSTASLDSQCSKDSGIDTSPLGSVGDVPPDHASALAHAVAARAARLAAKEGKDGADGKKNGVTSETPADGSRVSVEEASLMRPSVLLQERKSSEGVRPKSGSFGSSLNGVPSSRFPATGNRDHNDNETMPSVVTKLPPPTKPKPSFEKRASGPVMAHRESKLEAVPEDVRYPNGYVGPLPTISTKGKTFSEEDLATMYLDEVISEAAATIDSDLISVKSLRMESPHHELVNGDPETKRGPHPPFLPNCEVLKLSSDVVIPPPPVSEPSFDDDQFPSDGLPPPLMFAENLEAEKFTVAQTSSPLPPPPDDFLDEGFEETTKKSTQSIHGTQDPPPPYSPPRSSVSNLPETLVGKSYADWNADDVLSWLEFINMAQYKAAFLDNDIRGIHLPELTKEDLAELGVKKLGHRMTIDDAISKLCRAFTEV